MVEVARRHDEPHGRGSALAGEEGGAKLGPYLDDGGRKRAQARQGC